MFTGIIEEVGRIIELRPLEDGREFRILAPLAVSDVQRGDSISVDGVCLTVTDFDEESFRVQAVATTLERTTLGGYDDGRRVNLERAMKLGGRLGGHLVQGHVDGVAEILEIRPHAEHVLIDFTLPPIVAEVTILHGSITLNGVSLTVNALPGTGRCQVSIIPHTWDVTALSDLVPGSPVNLEGDLIGKYVRHLMRPETAGSCPGTHIHAQRG